MLLNGCKFRRKNCPTDHGFIVRQLTRDYVYCCFEYPDLADLFGEPHRVYKTCYIPNLDIDYDNRVDIRTY